MISTTLFESFFEPGSGWTEQEGTAGEGHTAGKAGLREWCWPRGSLFPEEIWRVQQKDVERQGYAIFITSRHLMNIVGNSFQHDAPSNPPRGRTTPKKKGKKRGRSKTKLGSPTQGPYGGTSRAFEIFIKPVIAPETLCVRLVTRRNRQDVVRLRGRNRW